MSIYQGSIEIARGESVFVASLKGLEDSTAIGGRRVDAVINGINYEFKNLSSRVLKKK